MIYVESKIFTKLLPDYLSDEEYRGLQNHLALYPEAGDLIKGTGGIRKVRWAQGGKGKSGGVRVIYYWQTAEDEIYFLTLYSKGEATDLTAEQRKILKRMVESW